MPTASGRIRTQATLEPKYLDKNLKFNHSRLFYKEKSLAQNHPPLLLSEATAGDDLSVTYKRQFIGKMRLRQISLLQRRRGTTSVVDEEVTFDKISRCRKDFFSPWYLFVCDLLIRLLLRKIHLPRWGRLNCAASRRRGARLQMMFDRTGYHNGGRGGLLPESPSRARR